MSSLSPTDADQERVKKTAAKYSRYGSKLDQAMKTVLAGGVKEHRFLPSRRTIVTVVGRQGDEFIDPQRSYCSCSHYFFRVVGGRDETCYHLLSHKIASELGKVDVVTFDDSEYGQVFATLLGDVFGVIERSSGRPSLRLD
jgi:predicted nucleic acid-binding Zn finger protein